MKRERIEWDNLQPLPRKKREVTDLEAYAERKYHREKAKHKGRAHWYAYQKRQRAKLICKNGMVKVAKRDAKAAAFKLAARAYWLGQSDEHP